MTNHPAPRKSVNAPSRFFGALLLIGGLLAAGAALAESAGQVTHLSGTLGVTRLDGSKKLLAVKSDVQPGDLLTTEQDTYARIKFADGGEVVMRPGTQLKIESYSFNEAKPESDSFLVSMFKGGLRAVTGLLGKRSREKVQYNTATATIGIRGTHFGALLCQNDCGGIHTATGGPPPNGLHVDVASGAIVVSNAAGSQIIDVGQFGFVPSGQEAPRIVPPQQGIRVTMPQYISQNNAGGHGGVGASGMTECAAQ